MINHFRTLLLNRASNDFSYPAYYAEEFVDPDYQPLPLPEPYGSIRRILFGENADRLYENYRAREYVSIVGSSRLREVLTAFDSRLTHTAEQVSPLVPCYAWQVAQGYCETMQWRLLGDYSRTHDPILDRKWRIKLLSNSALTIRTATGEDQTLDYEWEAGLPLGRRVIKPIELPGSDLHFLFHESDIFPEGYGPTVWLTVISRPLKTCLDVLDDLNSVAQDNETLLRDLFGESSGRNREEPWQTFYNCFYSHPSRILQLAGVLSAYVYGLESLRHGSL